MSELDSAIDELERAAARLRTGEIEPEEAAELVERCAQLAARVGAELDRSASAAAQEPPPDQERLL
jgi:exonuclease VII small subunit